MIQEVFCHFKNYSRLILASIWNILEVDDLSTIINVNLNTNQS